MTLSCILHLAQADDADCLPFSFAYCGMRHLRQADKRNPGLLFVKILLVCLKLALALHAPLPPCLDEAATIAHQLGERGTDRQQAYADAAVVEAGVDEDEDGIEHEWRQGNDA